MSSIRVEIFWTLHEWAATIAALPVRGPLPCRTVLVPRERVAHALRRELISAGRPDALAGTRFVLAAAAAVEVLRTTGVVFKPDEEVLRKARLSALFRSDLRLVHFPLDLLRSTPGWDDAFARTISDLEGAGLRPEDLEAAEAPGQLQDVAVIWRALDESARHSWTVQRVYREAALALERRPDAWPFRGPVLAVATGDLTAVEARFLRGLPQTTIGILAARPARTRYVARMEALLGTEVGAALASAEAPRSAGTERDLLASYLFELPAVLAAAERPRSTGPDGSVDLEEHAGVEAELEATTDWVARQVIDGTPLEEIAVLAPDLDPLAALVAERLGRLPWYDGALPVHVAGGLPLAGAAAGDRALGTVRALREHLAAGALADVLPSLRLASDADRRLSRRAAMNLAWSLGTVGGNAAHPEGALEWPARAAERQAELEEELPRARAAEDDGDETRARSSRELERLIADLRGIRPALDALTGIARRVVENARLSVLWPMLRDFFAEWLLQPGERPRVEVVVEEVLGNVANDGACACLSGDDALRVVEDAILAARVPVRRFGEPAVYIGALREAVGLRFAALRVIGLAEGHLPSMSREDPVIPDALREGMRGVPTAADRALANLHALDAVVRNAERRVALSAPRVDVERSQREPSSVILEAAAALARPNRATGAPSPVIPDRVALERDAFVPAREAAARFRTELPIGEAAWHDGVARRSFGFPRRWRGIPALDLDRIVELARDVAPGAMDGLLGAMASDVPVLGLSPDRPVSASKLATLLSCPHEFLLGHVLGFEPPAAPPPQREIGHSEYGRLFHAVAAGFYAENGACFSAHEGALSDWVAVADVVVDRAFEEFVKEYPLVGDAVRQQQRERLRRDVRDLLEYDWNTPGPGHFVAAEKAFGERTPVELRLGGRSLYLRGRIDRIDVVGQTSLVRDLKTGRAHFRFGKEAEPHPGVDTQIAVYGLVAELLAEEWNIPGRIAAAYTYVGRGADERSFRDDFHEALEPAARKWLGVAAGLLSQRLFPRTPHREDCKYCCFRPVCGDAPYERARALLAASDGVLGDFALLKAGKTEEE